MSNFNQALVFALEDLLRCSSVAIPPISDPTNYEFRVLELLTSFKGLLVPGTGTPTDPPTNPPAIASVESLHGFLVCTCLAPYYHTKDYNFEQSHRINVGKGLRILESGTHTINVRVPPNFANKLPPPGALVYSDRYNSQFPIDEDKVIEVWKWSQPPTGRFNRNGSERPSPQEGRVWVADLPRTGGTFTVEIDDTFKWITCMARQNDNGWSGGSNEGLFKAPFFQWHGLKEIILMTFRDGVDLTPQIDANETYTGYNASDL